MLWKETALIRALGLTRIPIIFFAAPRVLELDDDACAVEIPLNYRTRNHVGSMYIGALAVGADLAAGLNAARTIYSGHRRVKPIFKDFQAEFLKLADGDVVFRCLDGRAARDAVLRADASGERITLPMRIVATVPRRYGEEPVARFRLGLSVKRK